MKTFAIFATAALAAVVAASPTPQTDAQIVHSTFSFEKWVNDIIENPSTALGPEEAIAAWNSSITTDVSQVQKRQRTIDCGVTGNNGRANVPEAVWCINFLAGKNKDCPLTTNFSPWALCTWYNAQIFTTRASQDSWQQIWCNDVARAAGKIMDSCTRADNTVAGQAVPPDESSLVAVWLQAPQFPQQWSG